MCNLQQEQQCWEGLGETLALLCVPGELGMGPAGTPSPFPAPYWGTALDRRDFPAQHTPDLPLQHTHICLKTFISQSPDVDLVPFKANLLLFLSHLLDVALWGKERSRMRGKVKNANWEDLRNQLV